jgi:Rieske Fe-S protein
MTAAMTRRSVLMGSIVAVAGGVVGYAVSRNTDAAKATGPAPPSGYGPQPSAGNKAPGVLLTAVSKVPKGGGLIFNSQKVVVTRTAAGDVNAFTAICTHQGCLVSKVEDGVIECLCHNSHFSADTGKVISGPAPAPLSSVPITVKQGNVYDLAGGS